MSDRREWELPHLREAHQMPGAGGDFWSVKFYPYTEPGVDPVFAVVGGNRILVCRPPAGKESSSKIEIIQLIIDEEQEADHFACAWSKDLETGDPLLCVSGVNAKIKIINVLTGECLRTLAGHGGEVNDLIVSPVNPYILASASDDCTVRVWSLDPAHERQPCVAILEGDGHKETVLTLSFHKNGRYLISGGIDHVINLWTLPEFPDVNTGTNKTTRIFYPHFSTSEIHSDIVDCVAWHGDLILSKAANEDSIALWSINAFDSSAPPPPPSTAPTTHDLTRDTRSAFVPSSSSSSNQATALYTRHLQFSIPESSILFMRFSIFPGLPPDPSSSSNTPNANTNSSFSSQPSAISPSTNIGANPVLAFCNTASKVFFWDLTRLENYHDTLSQFPNPETFSPPRKHPFLQPFQRRIRGGGALARLSRRSPSATESSSSHLTSSDIPDSSYRDESQEGKGKEKEKDNGKGKIDWDRSRSNWAAKYDMGDPLRDIGAHGTEVVKGLNFTGRQVAWSVDGRWCVVVGSSGVVACLQRWRD
ncbi:WD40 repeat-like protein [Acephala macrosclerotiorum]|nr:WD40 repeat-like protein [Acephala macrosclerotiorum]